MIRCLVAAALVCSSLVARAAEPALILLEPADSVEGTALSEVMHQEAERLLVDAGTSVISQRQILAAAGTIGTTPEAVRDLPAARLAEIVGVNRFVRVRLTGKGPYVLSIDVVAQDAPKKVVHSNVALPRPLAPAVAAGARAMATYAIGHDPKGRDVWAAATPDAAVRSFATCLHALLAQPILLDSPAALHGKEIEAARSACQDSLAIAPQLEPAHAGLGLALALLGRSQEAVDALRGVPTTRYDPAMWLAHYWLAVRHKSPDEGLAILREVRRRHPASVFAHSLLADHLFATTQYANALPIAQELRAELPDSSVPRARVTALLAKLGRNDEAIAIAREGVARRPGDPRNQITLAHRLLDAGRPKEANEILVGLAGKIETAAVSNLLGWSQLRLNQLEPAERSFRLALERSKDSTQEWRSRGRAYAGLIRTLGTRGDAAAGKQIAAQAREEGFAEFLAAMHEPTVIAALDGAAAPTAKVNLKVSGPRYIRPTEATPFPLDPLGDVDPRSRVFRDTPNQLELLRY